MSFNIVLFPDPEKPTIANVSPFLTLNETLSIIFLSSNDFIKFLTSILIYLPLLCQLRGRYDRRNSIDFVKRKMPLQKSYQVLLLQQMTKLQPLS